MSFQREEKYFVCKLSEVAALSLEDREHLERICRRLRIVRHGNGKPPLKGVFCKEGTPEHDIAWGIIQLRVSK
jgi:hypothetical protein